MTLYSGQIAQMLQGVSQQHPKDRGEGQIAEQINCVSDIVEGLRRRPAFKVLAELEDITTGFELTTETAVYSYARGDGTEEYIMLFDEDGEIKIYNAITGAEATVSTASGGVDVSSYLTTTDDDPKEHLRFHTIADTTFVLNTQKVPLMHTGTSSIDLLNDSVAYCIRGSYGHQYTISLDGTVIAECTTPSTVTITATNANKQLTLSSSQIMDALCEGTTASGITSSTDLSIYKASAPGIALGFDYEQADDIVYMKMNDEDLQFSSTDGNHGNDLKLVRHAVPTFEELPKFAPSNYKIEVTGNGGEVFDNYWLQWRPDGVVPWGTLEAGSGVWQECVAPSTEITILSTYMPIKIVRQSDGTFETDAIDWTDRAAGDATTNPDPSFIGNTITDLGSYQNRLFFLTGENVVMSRAFDRYSFFSESVAAPSDDDPIDSSSSDNKVTNLLHSAVFNGALILFSNNAQFIHPKDIAVTPALFTVASDTQYNVSPNIKPVVTGSSIVFPTEFGDFTNVWEYNLDTLSGVPKCESITRHIPRYIVGNPVQMAANTTTDYVFLRTDDDATAIYCMQFYSKDDKRAQLAWHKWTVPNMDAIITMTLLNQRLYIVGTRDGDVYLEFVDLALPLTDNTQFELFLDHWSTAQSTYAATPWVVDAIEYNHRILLAEADIETWIQGTGGDNEGFALSGAVVDSGYIYFNSTAEEPYVIQGYPFESSGTLTAPYVRDQSGRPFLKSTILDQITMNMQQTGYVDFIITHAAGDDYTQVFNGIILNHWQYQVGIASLLDVDLDIPIRDYRELIDIKFESDNHLGFALVSMDWLARMTTRGRRSQ